MSKQTTRRLVLPTVTLAVATVGGVLVASALNDDRADDVRVIYGSPAGYTSIDELLRETDVTLAATVVSEPRDYVDFGADGKPDYDGQPGLPVQLVTVRVDDVIRGDRSLSGTLISVTQPSPIVQSTDVSLDTDRVTEGQRVVLVGRLDVANPGVGEKGESLVVLAGSGFGVFDVQDDGAITSRIDGALGATTFTAGKAIDPALLAGDS